MKIKNSKVGEALVIIPMEKRIDASLATDFKGQIVDWINDGHYRIVLDLSYADLIDSSGLGAIVSCMKTMGKQGHLVICGVKETVMRLFQLTRMDRVFQIFPSQHEAIRAITD